MPLNILYRIDGNATIPSTTSVKGSPLSSFEIDGNFRSIKDYAEGYLDQSVKTTATPAFAGANIDGVLKINEIRYFNSFIQRFAYDYSFVTYLNIGETQKIFQITPSASSQNYSIYGKIYIQSGNNTQVLDIYCHLRSNVIPDLSWVVYYDEDLNGISSPYVKPVLWTKETATAGFIFGIEGLVDNIQMATADLYVVNRSSSYYPNVQFLSGPEVSTIDAGFTSNDFTLRKRRIASVDFQQTIELNAGVTYDPSSTGAGTDTSTTAALSIASGSAIVGHYTGYIRNLLSWTESSNITIGASGTSLITGIDLLPGASGDAKVNGNKIWHAGNDGSGSSLDADTLDTYQASDFPRKAEAATITGDWTFEETIKFNGPTATSTSAGAAWFNASQGAVLFDDSGQKRITWNDGGGNFNIRTGNYYNGTTTVAAVGSGDVDSGATHFLMTSDFGGAGSIQFYVAGVTTAGSAISWTNNLLIDTTASGAGAGGLKYNGVQVWHAGNDGAASGLDADLLDGQHGSYYLDWTNVTSKPNYVTSITAGTDISVTGTASVGWTPTIANTSTLSSVTSRGATTATAISLTNTTESASSSTGALVVSGGVGVAKNLYVGQTLYATAKSFLIDHPTKDGMKLRHGSLEGPENGVYVRGRTKSHIIELPEYWTKLVDPDSITVQLTPIGSHQKLYVQKIESNKVYIENDVLSTDVIDCFYYIMAERIDIDKLEVEID